MDHEDVNDGITPTTATTTTSISGRKRKQSSLEEAAQIPAPAVVKLELSRAALRGMIQSNAATAPSLLLCSSLHDSRAIISARAKIDRFLLKHVIRRRKAQGARRVSKQARAVRSFKWLPLLMTNHNSSALREASCKFLLDTIRTRESSLDCIEQASRVFAKTFANSEHPSTCLELGNHLCTALKASNNTEDGIKRAVRSGLVHTCFSLLEKIIGQLVESDLHLRQVSGSTQAALDVVLTLISTIYACGAVRHKCQQELLLLQSVALLEAVQLGTRVTFDCAKRLRQLYTQMDKTPESTVREAGRALGRTLFPRLKKDYSQSFPFVLATSTILQETVNTIVPKYKIPDVTLQLQRAATQEEYFRSALAKSTISLADVPCSTRAEDGIEVPRVQDLKTKIATELGMSGSLEMFELLVAGKILGPDLDLPRVFEQIWKPHVAERSRNLSTDAAARIQGRRAGGANASGVVVGGDFSSSLSGMLYRSFHPQLGSNSNSAPVVVAAAAAEELQRVRRLAMAEEDDDDQEDEDVRGGQQQPDEDEQAADFQQHMLAVAASAGHEEGDEQDEDNDDDDDDEQDDDDDSFDGVFVSRQLAALHRRSAGGGGGGTIYPPMVVTYRLCAVDGEAREDFVSTLTGGEEEKKNDFYSATVEYGEQGLRALVGLVNVCVENLKHWPYPVGRDLLLLTLQALDQCVAHNALSLLRLGALPVLLRCLVESGNDAVSSCCLAILDRLVSGPSAMDDLEDGAFTGTDDDGGDQMEWVLERLDSFSNRPKLVAALAKVVPHLIYGRRDKAVQLAKELTAKRERPWTLLVIENLTHSLDAFLLRQALFELGMTKMCVDQLNASTTEDFLEHARLEETQQSLRLLKGLVKSHPPSALLVCTNPALGTMVRLEEVSSTKVENVGAHAFAVLDALGASTSSSEVRASVLQVQKQRQEEQRRLAEKKRSRAIKTMKSSAVSTSSSKKQKKWMDELVHLEEEDAALVCIVCHEGYRSKPAQLMCVYTFEKSIPLFTGATFLSGSGAVKQASASSTSFCLSSTSAFVCIHQQCHETAARTDRSHPKAPKEEWEGAELRNGHVRCNNLIPLKGQQVPLTSYDAAVHAFFDRVDRDTKVKVSSANFAGDPSVFSIIAHDLRLILTRISYAESLVEDTNGGSIESNLKLVVPLMQMGAHFLASDVNQRSNTEALLASFFSNSNACDFPFACILALFLLDRGRWIDVRLDAFFKGALGLFAVKVQSNAMQGDPSSCGSGLLAAAALQPTRARSRSRGRSMSFAAASTTTSDEMFPTTTASSSSQGADVPKHVRPWLVFYGLVDQIIMHNNGGDQQTDKQALEATQVLAQDARLMLASAHSTQAMAELLKVSVEDIRACLTFE